MQKVEISESSGSSYIHWLQSEQNLQILILDLHRPLDLKFRICLVSPEVTDSNPVKSLSTWSKKMMHF